MKRILSIILAISVLPVFFVSTATAATATETGSGYDASIFGNNAEYLLEEHFESAFLYTMKEQNYRRPSGWDVDYRGGKITTSGYTLQLVDSSTTEEISLKREILPVKSGVVTYETAVTFTSAASADFSLYIGEEENPILYLAFNNQNVYNVTDAGTNKLTNIKAHVPIYVKAEISMDDESIKLYIDNTDSTANDYEGTLSFTNSVSEFKNISFHTGDESAINTKLHYVNIYKNFLVNEKFMTDPVGDVPNGFTLSQTGTGSGIADAPGSTYKDDENGFLLKNTADISDVSLSKSFENTNAKTTVSWTMLMPEIQNGFYARIATASKPVATLYTGGGKLFANGQQAESNLISNLWYKVSVEIDTVAGTYDLKLNTRTVLEDIPLYNSEIPTKISFSKQSGGTVGEMLIDDIEIVPTFEKYTDYPTAPTKASSDGVDAGMVMYPMWREGIHYGWDTISPYADERKPVMGYYTEGQVEVADWQNKWLIEHGIDYAIYPFVRPSEYKVGEALVGEPVKSPVRGEDLMDGYMNSYYKDDLKFAIMLSQFSTEKYKNADDFVEYIVPYIKEYYFRNPNYMKINNKLPVFNYSIVNTSNAIGGYAGIQKIADALNAAAVDLGYDGIIYCADADSSSGYTIVNNINRDYVRIWNYTQQIGNVGALKTVIDNQYNNSSKYIPSISVGLDDTPWRASSTEMISAAEVKELCNYVKNHSSYKAETEKMVAFTCWNEYGEGHFFAPSSKEGFGYLNAIRAVFTGSGEKTNEESPSAKSVARMGVFYPNGRGALKLLNDMEYSQQDIKTREVLYHYDFTSDSSDDGWFTNNCSISFSDNGVTGTTTSTNPWIQCEFGDIGVPLSEVRALRIKLYQKGASNMQVFYHTTDYDKDDSIANQWGEFFKTDAISGSDEFGEYILHFNSEAGDMTGNISMIRLRFGDNTHSSGGKKFAVQYFELLGDPKKVEPIAKIDLGAPSNVGNCTAEVKDDVVVATATASDPQLRYTSISETVDMSKVKAIKVRAYTQNTSDLTVFYGTNGNVTYQHSPYKFITTSMRGDGSFREYILNHDALGTNPSPTGNLTSIRIDPNDNIIEEGGHFGIDWIEFYDKAIYDESYPIALNIEGVNYKTTSPIQDKSGVAYVPVYSMLLKDFDSYVIWNEPTKTLTVEKGDVTVETTVGSKIATVNGKEVEWDNAPYYEKGNIFVPAMDFFSSMGYAVDYVPEFRTINCSIPVESLDFRIMASDEDYVKNIAPGFWDPDTQANDYFLNGTSIKGNNLSDITFTLEDGEDAIKITPPGGAGTDALFVCRFVNYDGEYMTLKNFVSKGTKMKVSFSYMGVGTRLEVTSREAGGGNTQSAPNATISPTEWKTFEYVFDNSQVTMTSESRWLALRLKTAAGTNPYLYVKDFVISYPEEVAKTEFNSNEEFTFELQIPTGSRTDIPYKCYLAEYNGNELVNLVIVKEGSTADAGDNVTSHNYTPTTGNKIKILLWSEYESLCKELELNKRQ